MEIVSSKLRSTAEQDLMTARCCCCVPLDVACFTLGYMLLIINFFRTVLIVGGLTVFGMETEYIKHNSTGVEDINTLELVQEYAFIIGGVALFLNLVWLGWILCMLIGLHKNRPGPICLHMTVGCLRFVLLFLALGAVSSHSTIITSSFEIIITGSFLIVYHGYATRLRRSQEANILVNEATTPSEISVSAVHFAYPRVLDKQHLVEKEKY